MKKIVDFLEKHVQWVAVGIGGLYLLFTLWGYVINDPLKTDLQGQTVDLASVNDVILEGPGQKLQQDIASTAKVPGLNQRPQYVAKFVDGMKVDRKEYQALALGDTWAHSAGLTAWQQNIETPQNNNGVPNQKGGPVQSLPVPPAPTLVDTLVGRSTIASVVLQQQPPQGQPNPQQPAQPQAFGGGQAGFGNQPQQPTQPAEEDKIWVTVEGKINVAPLAAAMASAKIPQAAQLTQFLRLQMVRQELGQNGAWANETVVLPPAFLEMPPMPPAGNRAGYLTYSDWALGHNQAILQPPFYAVLKGDHWHLPSDKAGAAQGQPAFNPADLKQIPRTDEEKKARRDHLKQLEEQKKQQRMQRAPGRGGRGGAPEDMGGGGGGRGPGGPAGFAPRDADRPVLLAQARPGYRPTYAPPVGGPPSDMMAPEDMGMDMGGMPGPQFQQYNASEAVTKANQTLQQLGTQLFDPSKITEIPVWGHDETVTPGKTYRYRLQYVVLNPLLNAPQLAGNPKLAQQFGLVSEPSEWTPAITVPNAVSFYVASGVGRDRVNFRIYKWQNGVTTAIQAPFTPGDMIAKSDNNVDYTTGWTVVDIRPDARGDNYVLLTDNTGKLIRRDFRSDDADPTNRKLKRDVDAQNAANANAPGGPVGAAR
jgi:hypothetical protein